MIKQDSDRLKSFVSRIEKLLDDKDEIVESVKEIYQEVKSAGYDPATLRAVIAARRKNPQKLEAAQSLFDLYMHAIGSTPLEEAIEAARATESRATQ